MINNSNIHVSILRFPSPELSEAKPEFDSTKWLYEAVKQAWPSMTLSTKEQLGDSESTIGKAAYYSISPKQGFRVISLNTNFCYSANL